MLLSVSILLMFVQDPSLLIAQTSVSLSTLICLVWFASVLTRDRLILFISLFAILCLYGYLGSLAFNFNAVYHKIISTSLFLSIVLSLAIIPKKLNSRELYQCLDALSIALVLATITDLLLKIPGRFALFGESSWAHQFLASSLYGFIFLLIVTKPKPLYLIAFFCTLNVFLVRGTHILSSSFVFLPILLFQAVSRAARRATRRILYVFSIFIFALIFIWGFVLSNPNFSKVFDIFNPSSFSNASSYAWLLGLSQLIQSFGACPLIGCGPGSTGIFSSYIEYYFTPQTLTDYFHQINTADAYSLFFKLSIELGFVFIIFALAILVQVLRNLSFVIGSYVVNRRIPAGLQAPAFSLYIFSLSMFVGNLIKDPNLWLSHNFLPLVLFTLLHKIVSFSRVTSHSFCLL